MLAFLLSLTFVFPPVLMYHRVDVDVPRNVLSRDLTVTPEVLDEQLRYLRSQGLMPVSMADYERQVRTNEPTGRDVIVTFDDGYSDQYFYAFPVLEREHADATFYVVTGNVGRRAHVTWTELQSMLAHRMDVEAHGETHDDLATMNDARQRTEIDGSIEELKRRLRLKSVSSYAYPSGRFNLDTLRIERAADVPIAVTTDARNLIGPPDALQVVRIRVRRAWTLPEFGAAVRRALEHPQVLPQ